MPGILLIGDNGELARAVAYNFFLAFLEHTFHVSSAHPQPVS
jgi:hypothetical protein